MLLSDKNYIRNSRIRPQGLLGENKFSGGRRFLVKGMNRQGFIDCQWGMGAFRYGICGSDRNGCGWIAAYNLLRLLGENPTPQTVIREFERYRVVLGIFGSTALGFAPYFKRKGYTVRGKAGWNINNISRFAAENDGTVLFYFHPHPFKGAHFVAAAPHEDGRLIFYNALNRALRPTGRSIDGIPVYRLEAPEDIRSLEQFVRDEKAYYHSKWLPVPFFAIGVSDIKKKTNKPQANTLND